MGRRINDLDDRDFQARTAMRIQLRARRETLGLSQRALGQILGYAAANIRRLEREGVDQSYTTTIMRWARALGFRLMMQPVGFPPPARSIGDSVDDLMAALGAEIDLGGTAGDAWEVNRLTAELVGIRLACRVTQPQLARQFKTTDQNVSLIETSGNSTALVVLQRHARAIGRCSWRPDAHLAVWLDDETTHPRSVDTAQLVPSSV
jgi:transcriptional regulator with XRE-family HTH domain